MEENFGNFARWKIDSGPDLTGCENAEEQVQERERDIEFFENDNRVQFEDIEQLQNRLKGLNPNVDADAIKEITNQISAKWKRIDGTNKAIEIARRRIRQLRENCNLLASKAQSDGNDVSSTGFDGSARTFGKSLGKTAQLKRPDLLGFAIDQAVRLFEEGDAERGLMSLRDLAANGGGEQSKMGRAMAPLERMPRTPEGARQTSSVLRDRLPEAGLEAAFNTLGLADERSRTAGRETLSEERRRGARPLSALTTSLAAAAAEDGAGELERSFGLPDLSTLSAQPKQRQAEARRFLGTSVRRKLQPFGIDPLDSAAGRKIDGSIERLLKRHKAI